MIATSPRQAPRRPSCKIAGGTRPHTSNNASEIARLPGRYSAYAQLIREIEALFACRPSPSAAAPTPSSRTRWRATSSRLARAAAARAQHRAEVLPRARRGGDVQRARPDRRRFRDAGGAGAAGRGRAGPHPNQAREMFFGEGPVEGGDRLRNRAGAEAQPGGGRWTRTGRRAIVRGATGGPILDQSHTADAFEEAAIVQPFIPTGF